MKTYNLNITASSKLLADILTTTIESGDPVTTAAKGGWCYGIYARSHSHDAPKVALWYASPLFIEKNTFLIEVLEVCDENKYERGDTIDQNIERGALLPHFLRRRHLLGGLTLMAQEHGKSLGAILGENFDAADCDTWLQFATLGKLVYG